MVADDTLTGRKWFNRGLIMYFLDAATLKETRDRMRSHDASVEPSLQKLRADAEEALRQGPWSVTSKTFVPPTGDKHDFMSVAIYWWPNPETADGLPYIWKDGVQNPAYWESDGGSVKAMTDALETLSLAYYFTLDERYAAHAIKILRNWFIDKKTRMNPHLQFAQAIPGKCNGRSHGLVSVTQLFYQYPDIIALIRNSSSWSEGDESAMKAWFAEFLDWMLTHEFGQEAAAMRNNHGTWCNIALCSWALYTGKPEVAERILRAFPEKFIADQIEPDGKQPHELWRTRSFLYSIFNLFGHFQLATLAEPFQMDLWNFQTSDGRSIRKAALWLSQYAHPETQWPYPELDKSTLRPLLYSLVQRAAIKYDDSAFESILAGLPEDEIRTARSNLLYGSPLRRGIGSQLQAH